MRIPVLCFGLILSLSSPVRAGLDPWSLTTPLSAPPACAPTISDAPLQPADAVALALCNHPQTRETWAAARSQAALVGVARGAWLPTLNASAGVSDTTADGRNTVRRQQAGLGLSWLLFDFGQRSAGVSAAQAQLEAALATRDATGQSIFLNALHAFYGAQAAEAALGAAEAAEKSAQESLAAADLRYQVGVATPADRLQARTALSQATLNRQRAAGEARTARGVLANALGLPAQHPLRLAEPAGVPEHAVFRRDLERMIDEAQQPRPDLRAAAAQVRAAEASIAAARRQGLPTLSLAAGRNWQNLDETGESRGNTLGVTVNIPLFAGFDTVYRVQAAQAQREARLAQAERLQQQVSLDVWRAYHQLETASLALETTRDLLASATQSADVALGRYKAGVGSVLDLLSAQSALANARVERVRAELDWHRARATLAQAMGQLDDSSPPFAQERP